MACFSSFVLPHCNCCLQPGLISAVMAVLSTAGQCPWQACCLVCRDAYSHYAQPRICLPSAAVVLNGMLLGMQSTFEFHWGKHHRAYITNLNGQIKGTDLEGKSLVEVRH